ncbi:MULTISPECIES: K+/H+ antiporter subunit F [Rheinheimera]|jgi:multicomponent K+:H+ antiporter subunit F|uniref:K+/H+ antiporter subunit F n=1 Tax=Rheinheimera tilapiae TaxID=875043 RepID=A0ABV6BEK7_9GAMM
MFSLILIAVMSVIVFALLLNGLSLLRGPDLADRLLALDTMYINSIALLLVYGIYVSTQLYFEAALLIAMLGFVSTVAVCKFMLRGDIIE